MATAPISDEILEFFKVFANAERLKIAGLLALEPRTTAQLAEALHLRPMQVTRHLALLLENGLVAEQAGAYRLDERALQSKARRGLAGLRPRLSADDFEGQAYERKVLSDFFLPDGRLKSIPAQDKKLLVVIAHLAGAFEPGVAYTEKQVNQILQGFYNDPVSLRRYLVDLGFLERDPSGKQYQRVEET